ncbi:family 43 glycosylhydrolase [Saccharicrinis sp. FJH2]|uniref:family 43 glycosylhydrolase n=1 Tax=Saccharicrinis sp. FJH65 TaxID=3344659 RepID=UPI0035F46A85
MAQERPPVHDPVMMKQGDTYYVFSTGWGISVQSSKDLKTWEREKRVFEQAPEWTKEAVEGFRGHMWAPDIAYFNGQYYLFYSVSAFGKNTSCIGLATNKTLDPDDPEFEWVDQGKIIQSYPGKTNWNAIDPNFIVDKDGTPYLTFGSFWDGLKLVKLAWDGKSVDDDLDQIPTIASRKQKPGEPNPPAIDDNPKDAGGNAIEAPFVFKKGKYYYLFASIDYCCKGPRSTYKIIVGRSKDLAGPYKDKDGNELKYGGGSIVLKGDDNWYGIGHNAVYSADGKDYLICHGYDANDKGKSKLIVTELTWDKKKWPVVEEKL